MTAWSDTPIGDSVARDLARPLRRRRLMRRNLAELEEAAEALHWQIVRATAGDPR